MGEAAPTATASDQIPSSTRGSTARDHGQAPSARISTEGALLVLLSIGFLPHSTNAGHIIYSPASALQTTQLEFAFSRNGNAQQTTGCTVSQPCLQL